MASSSSKIPACARRLDGKVAVITGGACTARLFLRHGARVVVADIQDELGTGNSSYVHCDVTVESHVAAAVDHAVATFGGLDVMFNNAGIGGEVRVGIRDAAKEDLERVLAVNLVPAGRGGCVVSTSSVASAVACAAPDAYTASKCALVGLAESAAAELGRHGIRVNCVAPAGVATPLATASMGVDGQGLEALMEDAANLKGVGLKVDDVAAAVLFLASEDGRYVSGQNLLVDGGFSVVNTSFGFFKD